MPITINGTGTMGGISVGGLDDGIITNAELANSSVSISKLASDTLSVTCRAWVNFDGTIAGTRPFTSSSGIRASYNVSSITYNSVGSYTVNFTTALADANYSVVCNATFAGGNIIAVASSSSAASVGSFNNSNARADSNDLCVAIFR